MGNGEWGIGYFIISASSFFLLPSSFCYNRVSVSHKTERDMSHFTTIKVQMKNGELLHQLLEKLGDRVECNVQVRSAQGDRTNGEYVIRQSNSYDLGLATAERITNWWQIFGVSN
jgi:hypothetical protein